MIEEDGELTVVQRLGRLLDRGLLPAGGPAEAAERLIERLERPARIALLGLPGAGKSSVLNLLAGTVVVPDTLRLPTIILQHGPEARMLCTLADGRIEEVAGNDLEQILTLNPALVTVELDLPSLKVISLLEVSAGPMETEQRRAAVWASKRADILIWCTTSYLPKEQLVWEAMPDSVKDNGFLFLTKTDLLGSPEAARGMLERVEQRAGEEFRQVLSISAKLARTAMPPGGPIDRDMFRDSGAAAVITTIKTRVQMAQRADTDMAELLLARHAEANGIAARQIAETEPDLAEATAPAPEWTPPQIPASAAVESLSWPEAAPEHETLPDAPLEPEFASDQWEDLEEDQEADADAVARIVSAIELGAEPEHPPATLLLVEVPSAPETQADPEPEAGPDPEDEATTLVLTDPEAPAVSGGMRLSDRIRQATPASAAAEPPVPLRTTWKSRNETATPPSAEAKPQQTPRKDIPKAPPSPRSKVAEAATVAAAIAAGPAENGPNEAAIAAMLAAAAAPRGEPRTPRDRSSPAPVAAPVTKSGGATPADRTVRTRLFGARKTAADAPEQEPAVEPKDQPEATPEAELVHPPQDALPAAEELAPAAAPTPAPRAPELPHTEPSRPAVPIDLASPRVAVLRERRPDPSGTERRERPRIAPRVVAAAPAPAAGPRSVPASEHGILDQAVALIISRADDLERLVDPGEKPPVDLILDHGRETTEQVIEVLSQATSTELRRINGDLSEVQDLIMLMQLEKGHAPADDAMTLILQIRRDLETLRAA